MGDREELENLRRLAELEAKAAGNAPTAPVAASQRDVRMAEPPAPARVRNYPGDAGASLSAADAFGAANDLIDKLATKFGGFVTDTGMDWGATPEGAAAAGTVAKMIPDLAPMAAGGVVGGAAKAPELARTLMQKAIKPSTANLATGKFERAADTMLERGINASKSDMADTQARANELVKMVDDIVAASKGTLSHDNVMQRLLPVYEKGLESGEEGLVTAAAKKMLANRLVDGSDEITVQMAQKLKQGADRRVGDKGYGAGLKPDVERDAWKAYRRGLKEDIEGVVPEVAPLNKEASDLINVLKVAGPKVHIQANKNPAGLGLLLAPGSGAAETSAFMLWLAERSPYVKSLLANELYSGRAGKNLGRLIGGADSAALMFPEPPKRLEDVTRK